MGRTTKDNSEANEREATSLVEKYGSVFEASKHVSIPKGTLRARYLRAREKGLASDLKQPAANLEIDPGQGGVDLRTDEKDQSCILTRRSGTIRTLEDALAEGHVDTETWEVERWVLNKWDSVSKVTTETVDGKDEHLEAAEMWQVKIWFKRRSPLEIGLSHLIRDLQSNAPILLATKQPAKTKNAPRRALEVCLMDPHLGLHCYPPESDQAWSLEDCEDICMWALTSLLELAQARGPFEEIIFPFGNDYLHADSIFHTTTAGTAQPEMMSWHQVYSRGIKLAITMIETLRQIAPVKVLQIPGNHDRQTSFTLGHVLWAYFHNTPDVHVDCGGSPYKFWNYGCNLVGFEHGHSVPAIRLAALMANEVPEFWLASKGGYREWHLGDQHRKGTSKPSSFEEQGVSVEYLPGLTPPNEWHRLKSYNWQKRGAMAFVWDYDLGPMDRVQVNINSWTGKPRGQVSPSWREQPPLLADI